MRLRDTQRTNPITQPQWLAPLSPETNFAVTVASSTLSKDALLSTSHATLCRGLTVSVSPSLRRDTMSDIFKFILSTIHE
jgi:hypothetical protein